MESIRRAPSATSLSVTNGGKKTARNALEGYGFTTRLQKFQATTSVELRYVNTAFVRGDAEEHIHSQDTIKLRVQFAE
uniref:Uncharacterized protein n=1 Tax=Hyaloperonospora arabidopsidis (strain Emoy2) TaxID=559515 RepID=M4BWU5_HYAAE